MDGFSYTNIFETKGAEYLVVIAFLLIIILWWRIMNNKNILTKKIRKTLEVILFNNLQVPQGLIYGKNHTWVFMERSGTAKIGLNELMAHLIYATKLTPVKSAGDEVRKGEVLAEIDQNDKRLSILSPISGMIIQPNPTLADSPDSLYDDPYGRGWIYSIRPNDWKRESSSCYQYGESSDWLMKELERYKAFLSGHTGSSFKEGSPVILQDGGELLNHSLSEFPDEVWKDFQRNFCTL